MTMQTDAARRNLLKGVLTSAALATCPQFAQAQSSPYQFPQWVAAFKPRAVPIGIVEFAIGRSEIPRR